MQSYLFAVLIQLSRAPHAHHLHVVGSPILRVYHYEAFTAQEACRAALGSMAAGVKVVGVMRQTSSYRSV